MKSEFEIAVIGGGLAGLVSAYLLSKSGHEVVLIEKKTYPFHRVCGEYLSNEALGFLQSHGLLPDGMELPQIQTFEFSDTSGQRVQIPLDLGGFGISRFVLDDWIFQQIQQQGTHCLTGLQVEELEFLEKEDRFRLVLSNHSELQAKQVIGAFGKRSKLDKKLGRPFIDKRSPYLGVKYHIRTDYVRDAVALHNFRGGYCGLNAIEEGKFNLCYLGDREQLRTYGSIEAMEEEVLWKNPILRKVWAESEFLFDKPEVITEINFEPKKPVENHILMAGDSAGLITPLCGNGMAMAIHAGIFAAQAIQSGKSRQEIETSYEKLWRGEFEQRLWVGRQVQRLFGSGGSSVFARKLIQHVPPIARLIIKNTHGQPF
ncbi:MAG: NAD(P)/FAD-dependent oxidoreductase [Cytophagales bacterium]|nr:MAG: NAD(P)/FAD-dependent oxidoreductase [Cytophagales bacterium]